MVSVELEYDSGTDPDRFDGVAWAMQESWPGIFVAGALFSLAYLFGVAIWTIANGLISLGGVLVMLLMMFVVPVVGVLVTLFWSIFAFILVLVFNLTIWEFLNRRTAVTIFGGATGFLATYWQIFDWANVDLGWGIFCLIGIWIALLSCQIGALRCAHRRNVFFAPSISESTTDSARYQFGIKQMLAATVLFGLLFAADRMVPRHEVLVMAGVYAVFQLMGLGLDRAQLYLRSPKPKSSLAGGVES